MGQDRGTRRTYAASPGAGACAAQGGQHREAAVSSALTVLCPPRPSPLCHSAVPSFRGAGVPARPRGSGPGGAVGMAVAPAPSGQHEGAVRSQGSSQLAAHTMVSVHRTLQEDLPPGPLHRARWALCWALGLTRVSLSAAHVPLVTGTPRTGPGVLSRRVGASCPGAPGPVRAATLGWPCGPTPVLQGSGCPQGASAQNRGWDTRGPGADQVSWEPGPPWGSLLLAA